VSRIADARSFARADYRSRKRPFKPALMEPRARGMRNMNAETKTHTGRCFCGSVEIVVRGQPIGIGYFHCQSCRSWSAWPVNAFTLWAPESVEVTRGEDKIGSFHKTENSVRKWCLVCGGHLMTEHPLWKLIDVYAATIPGLPFKAGVHVNYEHTVLP